MSTGAQDTLPTTDANRQVTLEPGGYSRFTGDKVSDRERLLSLTGVFVRGLLRGIWRKVMPALALLPAIAIAAYALARGWATDQAAAAPQGTQGIATALGVESAQQTEFLVSNMGILLAILVGWILLWHVGLVAPLITRDKRHGALLLYFSRPVRKQHYLWARILSVTFVGAVTLALPSILLLLAHLVAFGFRLGGAPFGESAWLLWPALLASTLVASLLIAALLAVVSLGISAWMRDHTAASLSLAGVVLASIASSWVMQLIWGRNTLARSVDLHHALQAPYRFSLMALDAVESPEFATLDAAAGLSIWLALAVLGWLALQRFIDRPPLGRAQS